MTLAELNKWIPTNDYVFPLTINPTFHEDMKEILSNKTEKSEPEIGIDQKLSSVMDAAI